MRNCLWFIKYNAPEKYRNTIVIPLYNALTNARIESSIGKLFHFSEQCHRNILTFNKELIRPNIH